MLPHVVSNLNECLGTLKNKFEIMFVTSFGYHWLMARKKNSQDIFFYVPQKKVIDTMWGWENYYRIDIFW